MRRLKIIGSGMLTAVAVCVVFWLGGWDFERGLITAYMFVISIFFGLMAATIASENV